MVSSKIAAAMEHGSFIRKMFEEGNRLRSLLGPDRVYDFSIGNPDLEPPVAVLEALRESVDSPASGLHGYMSNNGYLQTRAAVADWLNQTCAPVRMSPDLVCMTVGAAGALNVTLKAILDPGDEVIVLAPYFVEYSSYIDNHGGKCVAVSCQTDSFQPDLERIAAAITPRTPRDHPQYAEQPDRGDLFRRDVCRRSMRCCWPSPTRLSPSRTSPTRLLPSTAGRFPPLSQTFTT